MSQAKLSNYDKTIQIYKSGGFNTQAARLLSMFRLYGWISTEKLSRCFKQYNARILELRQGKLDGQRHMIRSEKKEGAWGFRFFNEKED